MSSTHHGQTCTIVLFLEPAGELEALVLLKGTLDCTGEVPMLVPRDGGDVVRIPEHLMDRIETVTEEHRERSSGESAARDTSPLKSLTLLAASGATAH